MSYWLMKSEPDVFSIDDLEKSPQKITSWEGVRNYQARNMMRDQMQLGDLAFFYHSSCNPPGIVGIVEIVKTAHPDLTALDPNSKYFDPKSSLDNTRWFVVDVKLQQKFKHIIPLEELKKQSALKNLPLVRKGNRLSIMPISNHEWDIILKYTS